MSPAGSVSIALGRGEGGLAHWAALQGLLASPWDERLYRLTDARGGRARKSRRRGRRASQPGSSRSRSRAIRCSASIPRHRRSIGGSPRARSSSVAGLVRKPRLRWTVGILEGKRILVTGVLTDDSLAFGAARLAKEEGAEVALTGFGRGMSLTNRAARRLPGPVEVYELDVTVEEQANRVASELGDRWGALDGIVHSIGYAPDSCLGNGVLFQAGRTCRSLSRSRPTR